ncbi:MAG: SGNH/GDSL hydrolase family protein [Candidatus Zophobacter franzmannii]|nr:SGNH/GDSL hydrolase family protein [Candidatus Zophobacter franzmannii]
MRKLVILFLVIAIGFTFGCHTSTTSPETKTGELPVSLNLAPALEMSYRITRVVVTITRDDFIESLELTINGETATGTFTDLLPGDYSITVNIYEDDMIIGTGTGAVTIVAGETATATIEIIMDPNTGELDITVIMGEAVVTPTNILFIGNSITYYNSGVYVHLEAIAEDIDNSVDIVCDNITGGGMTLQGHWNNPATITAIEGGNYDYVIPQESTSWPVNSPEVFYGYVQQFDEVITNSGAQTVLFMSPPYQGTFETMIELQAAAYNYIGQVIDAPVIAVGRAFQRCRISNPEIELYQPDGNHPTPEGTYLAASMFYSALWGASPLGSNWDHGTIVDATERPILQNIAWDTRQLYHR